MCHVDMIKTTNTMCSKKTLGTCSRCGGRVSVPVYWMGLNAPDPSCENCGAVCYGPVIDMGPPINNTPYCPIDEYTKIQRYKGRKVRDGERW